MTAPDPLAAAQQLDPAVPAATMRKVTLRLIPFLLLLYLCNLMDRSNVSFAKSKMQADLGIKEAAFAFGTGLFYFGYLVFEVPSNLILRRTGARTWIARIMITWGLVSAATMLVKGAWSYYAIRILLGVAEAGFFPGIILYLTYWFPSRERTRAVASFMAANAVAGVITNPLSGAIMDHLHQVGGLQGWQWVFLLESTPSLFLGVCVFYFLTDRPEQATWLAADERDWLSKRIRQEETTRQRRQGGDVLRAMLAPRVWFLIVLYFTVAFGSNAGGLYLPELIRGRFPGREETTIGFLAAAPSLCGLAAMLINGAWSDYTGRYRLHVAAPAILAAAGWSLVALAPSPAWALAGMCLAYMGMMSMLPPFWSLPTSFLSGAAAAGGIALINSLGNVGGLLGPWTVGSIRQETGSHFCGLLVLSGTLFAGGLLAFFAPHDSTAAPKAPQPAES